MQYPDGTWWTLTSTTRCLLRADQAEELTTRHGLVGGYTTKGGT
ncbi:hypothetical protein Lxx23950 [Leifsonia xyli subsp. xyli str. CTCB07]|uniref:Uncharacterized protein n=1 Tax=Leifsonia xyli subsp. xyli (strain CTCB07) TaxID=281090 RepID=Q6AC61_LEIXX|nr:hypothetical protein Lxx23950 [Leifsonia xyli subsp. xyli str. CTCB07]